VKAARSPRLDASSSQVVIVAGVFGWSPETWTAVGTLTLALVTVALALATVKLAFESRDEARANWRPVLVPAETENAVALSHEGASATILEAHNALSLNVRNVGRGPALSVNASLVWGRPPADKYAPLGSPGSGGKAEPEDAVIAPDQDLELTWSAWGLRELRDRKMGAIGTIRYKDVTETVYTTEIYIYFWLDQDGQTPLASIEATAVASKGTLAKRASRRYWSV
jgi:hypothetical protein